MATLNLGRAHKRTALECTNLFSRVLKKYVIGFSRIFLNRCASFNVSFSFNAKIDYFLKNPWR
jgi:hypothetical protein